MNPRSWTASCLVSALLLVTACDNGSEARPPVCEPGDTRACDATDCRRATQTCTGATPDWGRCECDTPDPGILDAGPPPPQLGGGCSDDGDCPKGATCLKPDSSGFFGGGPPSGVCVADCTDDPGACGAFSDAVCISVQPTDNADASGGDAGTDDAGTDDDGPPQSALCFERCTVGVQDAPKCHHLAHVACEAVSESAPKDGFCRPLCVTDDDCGDRFCDQRSGACVDAPIASTGTFGASCKPDAGAGDCAGLCVDLTDDFAACSHRCIFGEPGDCTGAPSTPRGGCVFASEGGSIGDVGFCGELCDCPEQCSAPGAICDGFKDDELVRVLGRKGVCAPRDLAIGHEISCK